MAHSFSEDQINELKGTFTFYDKDGSGIISKGDLGAVIRAHSILLTDQRLKQILDDNGADDITFDKVLSVMAMLVEEKAVMSEEDMLKAIQTFDRTNSGITSLQKLRKVLSQVGDSLSETEIEEFMKMADKDGNGVVDNKELASMLMTGLSQPLVTSTSATPTGAGRFLTRERDK